MGKVFCSLLLVFLIPSLLAVEWNTIHTPEQLTALSPSEFGNISPNQLSRISASACSGFSGPQLKSIPSSSWSAFTGECVALISPTSLLSCSPSQITALSDQVFSFLSSEQCAAMGYEIITGLKTSQLSSMSKGCLSGFSSEQMVGLAKAKKADLPSLWKVDQWSLVNHNVVYAVKSLINNGVLIASLNWNDYPAIAHITWIQLALMRLETMPSHITPEIISSLPSQTHSGWRKDQVSLISPSAVAAMDPKAASFILQDTFSAMNGPQISYLTPEAFGALQIDSLAKIDVALIPFVSTKQIAKLNLNICSTWNCTHLGAMNRRQWRAWMKVDESFRVMYSSCKLELSNKSGNGTDPEPNNMPKYIAAAAIAAACVVVIIGAAAYFWIASKRAASQDMFDYQPINNNDATAPTNTVTVSVGN